MDDLVTRDHAAIAETLPDYAVGAVDDVTRERVARHLAVCASCRREAAFLLEAVGLLAPAVPSAAAKRGLRARAGGSPSPAGGNDRPAPVPFPDRAPIAPARSGPRAERVSAGWLVAAAVALLILPLGGWATLLQRRLDERELIFRLTTDPAAAHPLVDSELPTDAVGVLYADPDREQGYLMARGLPPLPTDQRYQIWLFTDDGERIGAGSFDVDPTGEGRVLLQAPAPFDAYAAAAVSAEPRAGSSLPTSPLALGGWLEA